MKAHGIFLAAMLVLTLLFVGRAQTPQPSPPADSDVVRISTNLIQLDVTVTDNKGNPIRDLSSGEIKIYENGKLQKITHLSFVPGSKPPPTTEAEKKEAAAAPVLPTGPVRPEQVRRTIAIVVDDGGFSWQSAFFVKRALKKYVEEQVLDGDLVAIIRTSGGIGALQQFTTDKRVLMAAAEKVKFVPGVIGRWDIFGSEPTKTEDKLREFRDEYYSFGGFTSLAYVIAGLNKMPGRKSIAFISDGWVPPQRGSTTEYERAQQNVVDYANRSSVVINTIQAAGVEYPGITASDNIVGPNLSVGPGGTGPIVSGRQKVISERQRPLTVLAEDTGGRAIVNNNIEKSIRRVFDDQSYYLVAYEPDENTFDPSQRRYNKLDVKVTRQDAKVRYRSGFFSFTEEMTAKSMATPVSSLMDALISPFAQNDVFVRMNAIFAADEERKSYVKTFVNVRADDLTFAKEPNGNYKTSFDIVAITVDARGRLLDERPKNYTLTLGQKEYDKIRDRGLVTTFLVPMPGPGGFQVRLAIRDVATGHVGSANQFVEIPDLKNKRLALSGIVLTGQTANGGVIEAERRSESDAMRDTSLRQFRTGSVLNFGYQIFNAKRTKDQTANLSTRLRLFREGKLVIETPFAPASALRYESGSILSAQSAVTVDTGFEPGDYLIQIEVRDMLRKDKHSSTFQFIQFDVVE